MPPAASADNRRMTVAGARNVRFGLEASSQPLISPAALNALLITAPISGRGGSDA